MDNLKNKKYIMFNLHFKFIYNIKKYNCDNLNNPPNYVFTPH